MLIEITSITPGIYCKQWSWGIAHVSDEFLLFFLLAWACCIANLKVDTVFLDCISAHDSSTFALGCAS